MSAASVRAPAGLVPPPPRARERFRSTWVDRFLGSDPGLNRFRLALQSVVSIGVILEAELLFVRFTHALQIQAHGAALPAAEAAGANHGTLVVAMLLGAIVGMNVSFGVTDPTARGQLVTMLFFPVPLVAALAFGIAIGGHRFLALASLVVVLTAGTYLRRFGPRGFIAGTVLFFGDFFGFFTHSAVTLGDLGWRPRSASGWPSPSPSGSACSTPTTPRPSSGPSAPTGPGPASWPGWPWRPSTTPGTASVTPSASTAS